MGHLSNESSATDLSVSATDLDPNHVHVHEGAHETAIGRLHMGVLPTFHVDINLLILINALCADARFQAAARTAIQHGRRRAPRCASRAMIVDGRNRRRSLKTFHARRTMPKP
jgi:hypothetical protein